MLTTCINYVTWIFKEVRHYLETGEELPPLSAEWKLGVLRQEVIDSVNLAVNAVVTGEAMLLTFVAYNCYIYIVIHTFDFI